MARSYNYQDIARELNAEGIHFDTRSDTRVLLAAIEHWGLIGALDRTIGMFAFALCDLDQQVVHLVRDRLGVKPMSFGLINGVFVFASEVSALEAANLSLGGADLLLDTQSLSHYVTHGHVADQPASIRHFPKYHRVPLSPCRPKGPQPRIITGDTKTCAPMPRRSSDQILMRLMRWNLHLVRGQWVCDWWRMCRLVFFYRAALIPV